jgi:hypothetical protein
MQTPTEILIKEYSPESSREKTLKALLSDFSE